MRILIIDDHPLFREILSKHLNSFFPSSITFEVGSVEEGLGLMQYKQFDLVCLDLHLPGLDGLKGFSLLHSKMPEAAIVIISGSANPQVAKAIMKQGANGYISKSSGIREIKNALDIILSGEIYISPCIFTSNISTELSLVHDKENKLSGLTPRQREVFELMSKGLPNKSIASQLYCSEGTIKLHVSAILRALKVGNRTEAAQVFSN